MDWRLPASRSGTPAAFLLHLQRRACEQPPIAEDIYFPCYWQHLIYILVATVALQKRVLELILNTGADSVKSISDRSIAGLSGCVKALGKSSTDRAFAQKSECQPHQRVVMGRSMRSEIDLGKFIQATPPLPPSRAVSVSGNTLLFPIWN